MITDTVSLFSKILPQRGRVLGLDLGAKRIGIAISDPSRKIASPLYTLQRTKFTKDASKIKSLCHDDRVKGLVIGLPINMDGSEGKACQASREFSRLFYEFSGLPILLWDERLSTIAITKTMIEADLSRQRQGEVVDKMAAAYILQGALDTIGSAGSGQ